MLKWQPEHSITDPDLVLMAQQGAIIEFNIMEHPAGGFYITVRLNWRKELLHLATRRQRDQPKIFMNLERLVTHIRENYVGVNEIKLKVINDQTLKPAIERSTVENEQKEENTKPVTPSEKPKAAKPKAAKVIPKTPPEKKAVTKPKQKTVKTKA